MYAQLIQFETRQLEIERRLQLADQVSAARARQAEIGAKRARAARSGPGRLKIRAALRNTLGLT